MSNNLSILDFYENFDSNLISFIKGHLFLENAMNLILDRIGISTNKTFSKKISSLYSHSRIDTQTKDLLVEINDVRNDISHDLFYKLTFEKLFELVQLSSCAGVDYSDDTIFSNEILSKEWYDCDGIINELFPNTFAFLLENNEDLFPDNEICNYLC